MRFWLPLKEREASEFGFSLDVHTALTPTIIFRWVRHHTRNMCFQACYTCPCRVNLLITRLKISSLINGLLIQHLKNKPLSVSWNLSLALQTSFDSTWHGGMLTKKLAVKILRIKRTPYYIISSDVLLYFETFSLCVVGPGEKECLNKTAYPITEISIML